MYCGECSDNEDFQNFCSKSCEEAQKEQDQEDLKSNDKKK